MDFNELQQEYEKANAIIAQLDARVAKIENLFCTVCSGVSLLKRMLVMLCGFCDVVATEGLPSPEVDPEPEPSQPPAPWPTTPEPEVEPVQDINNPPSVAFTAVKDLAFMGGRWYWLSRSNNEFGLYPLYQKGDGSWWYNLMGKIVVDKDAIDLVVANPWQPIPGGG